MADTKFGRIPKKTIAELQSCVSDAREVSSSLPPGTSEEVRAYALEHILHVVIRQWQQDEGSLDQEQKDDLKAYINLACSMAGGNIETNNLPIFKASLENLLEEWLDNQ